MRAKPERAFGRGRVAGLSRRQTATFCLRSGPEGLSWVATAVVEASRHWADALPRTES